MKIPRTLLHRLRVADMVLFYPALLLVIWGELAPQVPDVFEQASDKLLHFIAYFGLAGMAAVACKGRKGAVLAVIALMAVGGLLEIVQGFVGRDASIYDELANMAGALTGGIAARALVEALSRWFT